MSSRIAITLGASFLGYAAHAGFMARLHELGVRPVRVGGSSAGAITAGLYAAGLPAEKIREIVLSWNFRKSFVSRTPWLMHYVRNTFFESCPAVFKPDAAVDYLESILGDRQIEALRDPTFMAAVSDLETKRAHFLQTGSLARAMVASCCVPTISGRQLPSRRTRTGGVSGWPDSGRQGATCPLRWNFSTRPSGCTWVTTRRTYNLSTRPEHASQLPKATSPGHATGPINTSWHQTTSSHTFASTSTSPSATSCSPSTPLREIQRCCRTLPHSWIVSLRRPGTVSASAR